MVRRKPFDLVRAGFWLVAAIVAVHAAVVLAFAGACLVYAREIVEGRFTCDPHGRLFGLLDGMWKVL